KVLSIIWKYSSDVKNARSDITLLRDEIQTFRDVLQNVRDMLAVISQLKDRQQRHEQQQLLAKLPFAASASFDSYHRQHEPECIANTRVELLQTLQEWGRDHQRKILWLSGMAGTGKSTISRTLANRFSAEKTLGGNFFFSRASGDANHAANVVGTLAHQLANKLPILKLSICEAISLNPDVLGQGLRNQWKALIHTPLSRANFEDKLTVNIILDALDECSSDDDIRIILQLLVEVKDLQNIDLGVFVTSRPEVIIRLGFEAMPEITHQRLDLRDIPRSVVQHDILTLLESEFECIRRQHRVRDWPTQQDQQILVQRSDCLFIYAKTVCRYVGDLNWNPEERLIEVLQGNSTGMQATAGLDAMYTQVLKKALVHGKHEVEIHALCDRFKHVVGTIVTVFDELGVSAISRLLSMRIGQLEAVFRNLHSILDVPADQESPIRLLHPSFHDFLIDGNRCRDERLCVNETSMHESLVGVCLDTMSATLKRNSCHLQTPGSSIQDLDQGVFDVNLPKHVRYACLYWVDHLALTCTDFRARHMLCDKGKVHLFLQRDLLHWLEAMSLMRRMSQAVLMITRLAKILERVPDQLLYAVTEDARRFILRNRALIEEAPLQTYVSALIFTPAESPIRESYIRRAPKWVNRLPAPDFQWGSYLQTLSTFAPRGRIAYSPGGRYLAYGDILDDSNEHGNIRGIKLWDLATGALHGTLEGDEHDIEDLLFVDAKNLVSLSQDGKLRIWDPVTGKVCCIKDIDYGGVPLDAHPSEIDGPYLAPMPNGDLATLCFDLNIRIWNLGRRSFSAPNLANV
ncbi:MAG: hypothetical protein Q9174_005022, partial [Haloplaca sp. 1 TL-2023]